MLEVLEGNADRDMSTDEPTSTHSLRLDQCAPHGLAIHSHALRDRPHRDTTEVEPHRLCRFLDAQPWATTPNAAPSQMSRHRGAMHAYLSASSLTVAPLR